MSWDLELPAPAKLNRMLHIVGRRADGYHLLQTVFQFLEYGDTLRFRRRADGAVRRLDQLPGVAPEQDLILRAAWALKRETGVDQGADIALEKRLPMGGGLGGGSSDAATALQGLNRLWGLGLSEDRLAELGLALGADVPVFVRGRAAWGEGVGERLTPVELSEPWFLVLVPEVSVSTAEIFSAPDLTRDSSPITIRAFLAGGGGNDCEVVVRKRYPEVDRAIRWLGARGTARMTGTGAALFAPFDDEAEVRRVLREVPADWTGFVARGCNRSPLLRALAS